MAAEKIAITLEAPLLEGLEAVRRVTGESRSAVIARAVRTLLDDERRKAQVREYVEAYRRVPETADDLALSQAGAAALAQLPWDDE
jgi:metal-responsive CopG/Arc/MetJ family transcriptional regulator